MQLPIGKVVAGRYRIERVLGSGGMSTVYLASHTALNSQVAIKCIPLAGRSPGRVLREATAGATIRHPNVLQVFDVGEEDNVAFIIMEYLEGHDLHFHLQEGTSQRELIAVLIGAIEGLAAAHEQGVIHRDIKPSNLFVVEKGTHSRCIVLDFGLAKVFAENEKFTTGEHSIFGTPMYMAPEQIRSSTSVGPPADVYSLGVILYQIVSHCLPFDGDSLPELMMAKLRESPAPLEANCSTQLRKLIMSCLATNPRSRPTTTEMVTCLQAELTQLSDKATPPPVQQARGITIAINATIPPDFRADLSHTSDETKLPQFQSAVFGTEEARLTALQSHLQFYTQHVDREYEQMRAQVQGMHRLWLATVAVTILMTISAVAMVAFGRLDVAAAVTVAGLIPGWFTRVFHKREDHFRSLQEHKSSHLRYGRQWLMALQTADSLDDSAARSQALQRICEALLPLLGLHYTHPPNA